MFFHFARHIQRRRHPWTPCLAITVFLVLFFSVFPVGAQSWVIVQPLPVEVFGHVAAAGTDSNGDELLFVFGGGSETSVFNRNDVYDPSTNTWDATSYAPLPTARHEPTETAYNNKIWVIGGRTFGGTAHTTVEVYEPALDSWTTTTPPPLQTGRFEAAAAHDATGRIFVFGGKGNAGSPVLDSVEMYDTTAGTWTFRTPMPEPLYGIGAELACDDRIYVMGHNAAYTSPVNYAYDPVGDTWSGPLALPPVAPGDVPLGGRGLTKRQDCRLQLTNDGNYNQPNGDPRVYSYNPAQDTWRIEPDTDAGNVDLASAAVRDQVYAVGGRFRIGPSKIDQVETLGPIAPNSACDPDCVLPPFGMTAWYPFDEDGGKLVAELIAGHNGTHVTALVPVQGKVAGALDFSNGGTVGVPHDPAFNFFAGDFSVDFWVKNAQFGHVVGKYDGPNQRGWEVFFNLFPFPDLNVGLVLNSTTHDLTQCVVPDDGQWHHVALAVDRAGPVIRCYVNGFLWDTTPILDAGSVNNTSPLRMGTGVAISDSFKGTLDELELFNRVLQPAEIQSIAGAEEAGKCKDGVGVPWDREFCRFATHTVVDVEVCNASAITKTYDLVLQDLPAGSITAGSSCTIDGPISFEDVANPGTFIPPAKSVTVTGPGCINVPIRIERPVDMTMLGLVGCYQVILTDPATGATSVATGSVQDRRDICRVRTPFGNATQVLPAGQVAAPNVQVVNTDDRAVFFEYELAVMSAKPQEERPVLSLNETEPGQAILGEMFLEPGEVGTIPLTVSYVESDPLRTREVVLSTRDAGETDFVPLGSFAFRHPRPGDADIERLLGGSIWHDVNGDGIQGGDEPPLSGVRVGLIDSDGSIVASTTSDDFGGYFLPIVASVSHLVQIDTGSLPEGMGPTYDADGGFDNQTFVVLPSGQSHLGLDFGYREDTFVGIFEDGFESGDTAAWSASLP